MNGLDGEEADPGDARGALDDADAGEDRIEPGRPSTENVVFVVLGALGALYVVARIAGLV